jgi:hypothetical protein
MLSELKGHALDLKLIDELIVDLKDYSHLPFKELERESGVVRTALDRLQVEWNAGRMPIITLSLANYLRERR